MTKIIVLVSCAGPSGSFSPSPEPQDVPDAMARDLLSAGHAISPKEAKAEAAPKVEKTMKRTPKKETT
jgi:hypothetical protein